MIDLTFTKDNPNAREKKRNRQISTLEFIIVKIRSIFFLYFISEAVSYNEYVYR